MVLQQSTSSETISVVQIPHTRNRPHQASIPQNTPAPVAVRIRGIQSPTACTSPEKTIESPHSGATGQESSHTMSKAISPMGTETRYLFPFRVLNLLRRNERVQSPSQTCGRVCLTI